MKVRKFHQPVLKTHKKSVLCDVMTSFYPKEIEGTGQVQEAKVVGHFTVGSTNRGLIALFSVTLSLVWTEFGQLINNRMLLQQGVEIFYGIL